MGTTAEKYREFWADKTSPQSRCATPESLRLLAQELRLLFCQRHPVSVLEIGCGNGCLFDFLGFSAQSYRGVDFSPRMLDVFRHEHPTLDLIEAEGSAYADARTYDLILAQDVVAHFTPEMLAQHCANARHMMHSNSLLIWASIPWRVLRDSFDLGLWSNGGETSIRRWAKGNLGRMMGRDFIGRWYTTQEIARIAKQNSLSATFHGSVTHPYRFHAVLRA